MYFEEHLLVILSEECIELLADIESKNDLKTELNDIVSTIYIIKKNTNINNEKIKKINVKNKSINYKETIHTLIFNLHYIISKNLRFGYGDSFNSPYTNIELLNFHINKLLHFILLSYEDVLEDELIENKKNKVFHFVEVARKKGTII
jgi:hypothetical protein